MAASQECSAGVSSRTVTVHPNLSIWRTIAGRAEREPTQSKLLLRFTAMSAIRLSSASSLDVIILAPTEGTVRGSHLEEFRLAERRELDAVWLWCIVEDRVFQSDHLGPFLERDALANSGARR